MEETSIYRNGKEVSKTTKTTSSSKAQPKKLDMYTIFSVTIIIMVVAAIIGWFCA